MGVVRILTASDVEDLLDLPKAMACLEQAFLDQGQGGVTAWAPLSVRTEGAMLMLRSGSLDHQKRFGVRVTTGPVQPSYALVFEVPSGDLLSFMAYPFSELRLQAAVALGVQRLAKPGARRLGMLGSGRNALGLLQAAASVRAIESVQVFSPTAEHREAFAERASQALDVPVRAVSEPETAVEGAEIVLVATSSSVPALRGDWLAGDAHVASIGNCVELDAEVFLRAECVVTASKVQERDALRGRDDWPLARLTRDGTLAWDQIHELGEVLAGSVAVGEGISVFRDPRGGFTDVALACGAYERAVELGRGIEWTSEWGVRS